MYPSFNAPTSSPLNGFRFTHRSTSIRFELYDIRLARTCKESCPARRASSKWIVDQTGRKYFSNIFKSIRGHVAQWDASCTENWSKRQRHKDMAIAKTLPTRRHVLSPFPSHPSLTKTPSHCTMAVIDRTGTEWTPWPRLAGVPRRLQIVGGVAAIMGAAGVLMQYRLKVGCKLRQHALANATTCDRSFCSLLGGAGR